MRIVTVKRGFRSIHTHQRRAKAVKAPGSRSTLRVVKGMDEVKGMRSIPRWGRDDWEPKSEERRALLAYNRRMRRFDVRRGESAEQ